MKYQLIIEEAVENKLKKLGANTSAMILKWIKKNLLETEDPMLQGKALTGDLKGIWRYRIGDYRLLVDIVDAELVIIAIDIGHRREIYR